MASCVTVMASYVTVMASYAVIFLVSEGLYTCIPTDQLGLPCSYGNLCTFMVGCVKLLCNSFHSTFN